MFMCRRNDMTTRLRVRAIIIGQDKIEHKFFAFDEANTFLGICARHHVTNTTQEGSNQRPELVIIFDHEDGLFWVHTIIIFLVNPNYEQRAHNEFLTGSKVSTCKISSISVKVKYYKNIYFVNIHLL